MTIDAVLPARVIHGMKTRDRAADASHPEGEEYADGFRGGTHHTVNQIIKCNGHAPLRSPVNGNAIAYPSSLCRRKLLRNCMAGALHSAAMELLRTIQMRIEGRSNAANQKARIIRHSERSSVEFDDPVGNQILQAG